MYRKIEPGARKANGCIPPSDIYLRCLSAFPSRVLSASWSLFFYCHRVLHVFRFFFSLFQTLLCIQHSFSTYASNLYAFSCTVCHKLLSNYPLHRHLQSVTQSFQGYTFLWYYHLHLNADGFWCATESFVAIRLFVVHEAFWCSSRKISNQKHLLRFRNILVQ